jgi:hypothetical protein
MATRLLAPTAWMRSLLRLATGEPGGDLLQGPAVAVRVLERGVGVVAGAFGVGAGNASRREERAAGTVIDLGHVDAAWQ